MKRITMCLLLGSASIGCGSWSNLDLEFASALPNREELRSKLPETASNAQQLAGTSSRRDGLVAGEPSNAYSEARATATKFNGILDSLLTVLDQVRRWAPSSRKARPCVDDPANLCDSRIWGPFPDDNNPGFEFQVVVQRSNVDLWFDESDGGTSDGGVGSSGAGFWWRIQARPGGGDFFDVVTGDTLATPAVKKGRGTMVIHVVDFRDRLKIDENMKKIDRITIDYDTRAFPIVVQMAFSDASGPLLDYLYRENADRSGGLNFEVSSADPRILVLGTQARWTASGAGKTVSTVLEGTYQGAFVTECWDQTFLVSYYAESWVGGQSSGDPAACPILVDP
jgi:hypothetical protein